MVAFGILVVVFIKNLDARLPVYNGIKNVE